MGAQRSEASKKAEKYLSQNPRATAEEIARKCGLSVSAVNKSGWWKNRPKEAGNA